MRQVNLPIFVKKSVKLVQRNSPEILTALGISGVLATAYLTGKAAFKAGYIVDQAQYRLDKENETSHPLDLKEKFQLTWKLYIPAGISGIATITCIMASSKANAKRTAAAVTAYSITERAFSEYKDKVIEQIGEVSEQKIREGLAQEQVTNNPPKSNEVIIVAGGQVLCCELFTHRYFKSDMETLRKAQNDINEMVIQQHYITLDDFYDMVGLPYTSVSSKLGWDSDKLMELKFTTVLSEGGEPCLAFDYNYTKPIR